MRLAIDFGLHVSTKAYVEAGSMTVEEARGRSVTFWGAFATDQLVLPNPNYLLLHHSSHILEACGACTSEDRCTISPRLSQSKHQSPSQSTVIKPGHHAFQIAVMTHTLEC